MTGTFSFVDNTVKLQLDQTVGSVQFLLNGGATELANDSNTPNVTTPPFSSIAVKKVNGDKDVYRLQSGYQAAVIGRTYTITGLGGSGIVNITGPDGVTVAKFQQ
ncbi:hypothetical protein TWF481_001132 [Arthrobotrys musiformis]|uniref:Uncharacterized protein n=1 Tax=Arthrobotrys musiformis TaxID=47236 RepID=A0AAV9WPS4_9PEZI